MKHRGFYKKYKSSSATVNPMFSRENMPLTLLIIIVALLAAPLMVYKYRRASVFSFEYYVQQLIFILAVATPILTILFWVNWREIEKRSKGYGWVGKFEVLAKRSSFLSCYLLLTPGDGNKIKVDRLLFENTKVGDAVLIYRDLRGNIEGVEKVNDLGSRVARLAIKQSKGLHISD